MLANMQCHTCLNSNCLIKKNIDLDLMREFTDQKTTFKCKKGQQFVMEGAPVNGLFFVNKGKAKVLKTGINGKEQILRFVNDGEIIGHRGFGTREKYTVGASAIENTILCNFSSVVLEQMFRKVPLIAYDFMLFYAEELSKSEEKVKSLAQMTVREKVIDALLYIHRKFGVNHKGYLNLILTRKEIADFAGTTDEQVTRTLSALKKEDQVIIAGKKIGIRDIQNIKKEVSEHNYFLNS